MGGDCSRGFRVGDKVMALLPGGGYAEFAAADECCVMRLPDGFSFAQGAAIPEVWLTAFQILALVADVQSSDTVLVHVCFIWFRHFARGFMQEIKFPIVQDIFALICYYSVVMITVVCKSHYYQFFQK